MGFLTDILIHAEGSGYAVLEVLSGSESASTSPIGEIRRVPPFDTWAFVGREGCDLTRTDLAVIDRKLAELEGADRERPPRHGPRAVPTGGVNRSSPRP